MMRESTFTEWNWRDVDRCVREMDKVRPDSVNCEKLERVQVKPPFCRQDLLDLGIHGIEFAAFRSAHPSGLAADHFSMRSRDDMTTPGHIFQVDGAGYFSELDINQPLPFADSSIDWVYAEHLIEHVTPDVAVKWLTEVSRVLVPNGLLRLSTPDLARYIEGYNQDSGFFAAHRQRMTEFLAPAPRVPERRAFMINQIFYFFGHRWIYDFDELRYTLSCAGFDPDAVRQCAFGEGSRPDVAKLDQSARSDESIYTEVNAPRPRSLTARNRYETARSYCGERTT